MLENFRANVLKLVMGRLFVLFFFPLKFFDGFQIGLQTYLHKKDQGRSITRVIELCFWARYGTL